MNPVILYKSYFSTFVFQSDDQQSGINLHHCHGVCYSRRPCILEIFLITLIVIIELYMCTLYDDPCIFPIPIPTEET